MSSIDVDADNPPTNIFFVFVTIFKRWIVSDISHQVLWMVEDVMANREKSQNNVNKIKTFEKYDEFRYI